MHSEPERDEAQRLVAIAVHEVVRFGLEIEQLVARRAGRGGELGRAASPRAAARAPPSRRRRATSSASTLSPNAEPRRSSTVSSGPERAFSTASRNGANSPSRNGRSRSASSQVARRASSRPATRRGGAPASSGSAGSATARRSPRSSRARRPAAARRPRPRPLRARTRDPCRARRRGSGNPARPARRAARVSSAFAASGSGLRLARSSSHSRSCFQAMTASAADDQHRDEPRARAGDRPRERCASNGSA